MYTFVIGCRLTLGLILAWAGVSKLSDMGQTAATWARIFRLPPYGGIALITITIIIELAVAAILFSSVRRGSRATRWLKAAVGLCALFLLLSFGFWIGWLPDESCRCFGPWEISGGGMSMVLRNWVLFALSLAALETPEVSEKVGSKDGR